MIRFVEMVGIELSAKKSFGFYNTVEDKFINMNGCHAVDSVEEFKEMYSPDCGYSYDRLFSLIPNKWLTVAETPEVAFQRFSKNEIHGFIQWKGTDVCLDFHCECGCSNHYDGTFAYVVKCAGCESLFAPSCYVEMIKVEKADSFLSVLYSFAPENPENI